MNNFFNQELSKIKSLNNYRSLKLPLGMDFSSNDYLGLSNHPKIKEAVEIALKNGVSVGSGGSRLLRGNQTPHVELEEFAAKFFNTEKALFFSSGFLANYALFTTLPNRHDVILYDELIHASVRDGIQACNASKIKIKHNNISSLEKALNTASIKNPRCIWVAAESVYSMDGDISNLTDMVNLIKNYNNAYIIFDEAHSTGIFGKTGRGIAEGFENERLISVHTCGKALGVSGALVCVSEEITNYLINKARPFIYTTAESPLIAVGVKKALELIDEEPWRRKKLFELIKITNNLYSDIFKTESNFKSQIIPIILGDSTLAVNIADDLQRQGFDIRAVRPPTVPTARIRLSLNINRTEHEIQSLFKELKNVITAAV